MDSRRQLDLPPNHAQQSIKDFVAIVPQPAVLVSVRHPDLAVRHDLARLVGKLPHDISSEVLPERVRLRR